MRVDRGLWVDCPPTDVVDAGWWRKFRAHGLSHAALMAERSGPGFDERYSAAQLRAVGELALELDVEIGLTIWPEPRRDYLAELEQRLPVMLTDARAAFLDLDAESLWRSQHVVGFESLAAAAAELLRVLDALLRRLDVRLEVDTFPGHGEHTKNAVLMPRARRRWSQAYSVRDRAEGLVEWESPLGPGRMQRTALERLRGVPGDGITCGGLAAYDQRWPGRRGEDAMRVAYQAALDAGVEHVRWWSSRWVLGRSATGYGSRFLLGLAEAERDARSADDTRPLGR